MSSSRRGVNWSAKEDVVLCNAWVTISEDDAIGINQPGETFSGRIHEIFSAQSHVPRTRDSIEFRFKIINNQCSLWEGCVRKANATPRSGSNLDDSGGYIQINMFGYTKWRITSNVSVFY
ncbi:unnamed protein product [Cuscuta europaea]|uniref:Uncharacterized protein n=1 Tax=Cuscuta europaea TaxID=41803 RepID=A0A9P1DYZ3_CUSEU|nr:unnamed protein product [Cuscuta europaea]